jgi:hypothetical protein
MQDISIHMNNVLEAAIPLLCPAIVDWSGEYPLEADHCKAALRAGIKAGLAGQSAQFYAAQWMAQCYLIKPDLALMVILKKLDLYCAAYAANVEDAP